MSSLYPLFPPETKSTSIRSWKPMEFCSVKAALADYESKLFGKVCFSQAKENDPLLVNWDIQGLSAGRTVFEYFALFPLEKKLYFLIFSTYLPIYF